MNGTKVIKRLIHVFIVINIILFVMNMMKTSNAYLLSTERADNVIAVLRQREIYLDKGLPRIYTPKMRGTIVTPDMPSDQKEAFVKKILGTDMKEITISSEEAEGHGEKPNRVYSKDNSSLTFSEKQMIYTNNNLVNEEKIDLKQAEKECKKFLKKAGLDKLMNYPYIEERSSEGSTLLIFYPRFKGLPVFESPMQFYVTKDGIVKAVIGIIQVEPLKKGKTLRSIYPIDRVLFGLEDHLELRKPIHITDITLGYHSLRQEGMNIFEREIVPVYKIKIEGLSEPIFVNAYINEVIK